MSEKLNLSDYIKPPFTVYDFFGYLIPGLTYVAAVYLFEIAGNTFLDGYAPVHALIGYTVPADEGTTLQQTAYAALFLLLAYVLGHVIASVASLFIDRTLVSKAHGYPYEQLVCRKAKDHRRLAAQNVYRGSFFWLNVALWFILLCALYDRKDMAKAAALAFGILVTVTIGGYLCLTTTNWHRRARKRPCLNLAIFWAVRIFASGYNFVDWLLNRFFHWDQSLNPEVVRKYKEAFRSRFGLSAEEAGSENYWFSVCYIDERSPSLSALLRNWLHLYSFARNVATALFLAFVHGMVFVLIVQAHGEGIPPNGRGCFAGILGLFYVLALILAVRYKYLYFNYYSKGLYRSFAYLNLTNSPALPANSVPAAEHSAATERTPGSKEDL